MVDGRTKKLTKKNSQVAGPVYTSPYPLFIVFKSIFGTTPNSKQKFSKMPAHCPPKP